MKKMSEKAAWAFLSQEFDRYANGAPKTNYTRSGLCNAISELENERRISFDTTDRMYDRTDAWYYGGWGPNLADGQSWPKYTRRNAGLRALFASLMSEISR